MSKIRDEIKLMRDTLPALPFEAREVVLDALISAAEDVEKAAIECRMDKVFDAVVEVEWHRQTIGYLADGLYGGKRISGTDRSILITTALAVKKKVLHIAEQELINNCRCNF